jgi:NitT/TauT family transport system ATP-binding protein
MVGPSAWTEVPDAPEIVRQPEAEPGIVCRDVTFDREAAGSVMPVLSDVSLHVARAEMVSIIGPSGCGKSTLLNLVSGLLVPRTGTVQLGDQRVEGPRQDVGIVFQEHGLFPWLSVRDNVEFGLRVRGLPAATRRARAAAVLSHVGLDGVDGRFPHQLSGGMKQRVAIARVLANECEYLLMDEPFAALDYQTRLRMQQFLLDVWKTFGKTVLFVTHHVDEAILLSDRVLLMTARPGCIKEVLTIDLPRPRDVGSVAFNRYRGIVMAHLEREVAGMFRQTGPMRSNTLHAQ